jgi:GNAT superfamily N-acetyltransferase
MAVEVRLYRALRADEMEEWERLRNRTHPPEEARLSAGFHWAELDPETDYLVRLRQDNEVCACAWVTKRAITLSGQPLRVAGIRGVMTDPGQRRRGYGRAVMERAHELMDTFADCDAALLFSSVMAVPFYERLGWRTVPGPVSCEQPGGRINFTKALPAAPVMARGLRGQTALLRGPIHVPGLPW